MRPNLSILKAKVRSNEILQRILNGAFWSLFGTASAKLLILVASIVCARILGKTCYGQLCIVRSTINMFVVFGTAGMGVTASKYIAQYKNTDKEQVNKTGAITTLFAWITGIITVSIVLMLSRTLAFHTLHEPSLTDDIRIGAVLLLVTILNGAQNGILAGFEDFKSIAKNTFISAVVEASLVVAGAYYNGVFGALLGFGFGYVALYLCNNYSIRQICRRHGYSLKAASIEKQDLKILYKFSLPAALSSFLVMPAYWIVRTFIVRECGFAELGLYEASDQWRIIILFIPGALGQIVLPILSNVLEEGTRKSYKNTIKVNIMINFIITMSLSLFVWCFGDTLMGLNGKSFTGSSTITFLAFSTVFSSISVVIGNAIESCGKVWTGLCFNVFWAAMFVGMSYLLLSKHFGALGVSISLLLSYFMHTLFQSIYLHFLLNRIPKR